MKENNYTFEIGELSFTINPTNGWSTYGRGSFYWSVVNNYGTPEVTVFEIDPCKKFKTRNACEAYIRSKVTKLAKQLYKELI